MPSFHTSVCIPLEHLANDYFLKNSIPIKITADFIETGGFITIMDCLLQHKFSNDPEVLEFLQENSKLLGLPKHRIDDESTFAVYEKFCKIFNYSSLDDE